MPVSSLLIATTAAPYFVTSGRTRSRRSSSPVTELSERLALVDREAGLERLDDRRVDRQRQVGQALDELDGLGQDRRLVGQRDAGVDVEHVGAGLDLGEDVALDPAEVAGLHLLGQELAAGRVDPLADDDERPVEADDDLAGRGAEDGVGHDGGDLRCGGGRQGRAAGDAAGLDELGEVVLRVLGLEALGLGLDLGLDVVAARSLGLAPLRDVVVVLALAGPVGGLVDGDLEARMEDDLARAAAVLGDDLGRDVAPPDDRQLVAMSGGSCDGVLDGRGELAVAGRAALEGEAEAVGGGPGARRSSSGSSVWAR